jgi:hypothetical protein
MAIGANSDTIGINAADIADLISNSPGPLVSSVDEFFVSLPGQSTEFVERSCSDSNDIAVGAGYFCPFATEVRGAHPDPDNANAWFWSMHTPGPDQNDCSFYLRCLDQ